MPSGQRTLIRNSPVMMPGRTSGSKTSRRKRDLPGKLARSRPGRQEAQGKGENDSAHGDEKAVQDGIPEGGRRRRVGCTSESVKCLGGKPPTPLSVEGIENQHDDRANRERRRQPARTRRKVEDDRHFGAMDVALIRRTTVFRGVR